ncbi:hypothetical protein HYX00_02525 [Candidatus Woesearchaeota archaeon]|nr:hypothetical protein [Candidatus Woesearchaeota archaeon]
MKLRSKFIILILVFLLYSFVYKSETSFAQCSWTQCDSATCCNFYNCGGLDCDKEGHCWWTTVTCFSCYDCGSCYTVYNNGAACSTGSGPGVCSGGSCVPTCVYAANPCNCNTCNSCGIIDKCTGSCSIGSPPPTKYSAESCGCRDTGAISPCTGKCVGEKLSKSNYDGTTACCSSSTECVYRGECYANDFSGCEGNTHLYCSGGTIVAQNCQYGCLNGQCNSRSSPRLGSAPTLQRISASPNPAIIGQLVAINFIGYANADVCGFEYQSPGSTSWILGPTGTCSQGVSFTIPATSPTGTYNIRGEACQNTGACSSPRATATVQVNALPQISNMRITPDPVDAGTDLTVYWAES